MLSPAELGHHPVVLCCLPVQTHWSHTHTNTQHACTHVQTRTNVCWSGSINTKESGVPCRFHSTSHTKACPHVTFSHLQLPSCTHTHTHTLWIALYIVSPHFLLLLSLINRNFEFLWVLLLGLLYYSTSKNRRTNTHTHTHRKNVGHSERIYSRIQNPAKNLFPFNMLFPLLLIQCGCMKSSKMSLNYTQKHTGDLTFHKLNMMTYGWNIYFRRREKFISI